MQTVQRDETRACAARLTLVPTIELRVDQDLVELASWLAEWRPYADTVCVLTQSGVAPLAKLAQLTQGALKIWPGLKTNPHLRGKLDDPVGWAKLLDQVQNVRRVCHSDWCWLDFESSLVPYLAGADRPRWPDVARYARCLPGWRTIIYPSVSGLEAQEWQRRQLICDVLAATARAGYWQSPTFRDPSWPGSTYAARYRDWAAATGWPTIPLLQFDPRAGAHWEPKELPDLLANIRRTEPSVTYAMLYPGNDSFGAVTRACMAVLNETITSDPMP